MATIHYSANSYAGEVLEDLLVYTVQGNDTFAEGLIHIKPGIQHKLTLPHVGLGKIIQDNVATPTTQGAGNDTTGFNQYKFSERYLAPEDFMVYLEFNPRDFEDYWRPFQPSGELIFRDLDPKVQATMLRLLVDKKDQYIGDCIWASRKGGVDSTITIPSGATTIGGDSEAGPMKYFDGFLVRVLKNLKANTNVANANQAATITSGVTLYNASGATVAASAIEAGGTYYKNSEHTTLAVKGTDYTEPTGAASAADVNEASTGKVILAGSTALTTGAQVEAALQAMWRNCPKKLRKSSKLCFVMGWELWDLYDQYLSNKDQKYTENTDVNRYRFKGKRIVVINGIVENTIALGKFTNDQESCLWMGVDYATDQESVKISPLQANSELYFFQMRMKVDVNIVLPSEIVVWTNYAYSA